SLRAGHRSSLRRQGGGAGRGMRLAPHGGSAPQLALPARSPHRRLRAAARAVARLNSRRAKTASVREGKRGGPASNERALRAARPANETTPAALGYRRPPSGSFTRPPGSPGHTNTPTGPENSRP